MTVVRLKSIDAHGLSDQSGGFPFHSNVHLTSNVEQVHVSLHIYYQFVASFSFFIHLFACSIFIYTIFSANRAMIV
jgi:hypothetical protein